MSTILHVVDAFTMEPFQGNPAAVCVLEAERDPTWMQLVAREMNLAETAFLHPVAGGWSLRWFTPTVEIELCGHATVASAFVLWENAVLARQEPARFFTLSGELTCRHLGDWIEMDFPARKIEVCDQPPGLEAALGCTVLEVRKSAMNLLVEVADETALRNMRPDFRQLAALPSRGIIVTCRSATSNFDFVSRFFAPADGIDEDPVTGSAHCSLGPYWQEKLGKSEFTAWQASTRGGLLKVRVAGDRVLLQGQAVMISRVELLH